MTPVSARAGALQGEQTAIQRPGARQGDTGGRSEIEGRGTGMCCLVNRSEDFAFY